MKVAQVIISVYIAFLACYPCSDATTCVDEEKQGIAIFVANHEHVPEEIDFCSPLCICSCCSTQVNQPVYFYFEAYCPEFSGQNSAFNSNFVTSLSYAIWQPPKLALS